FFFFQAEDGIRYSSVTGVQTCALPILDSITNSGEDGSSLGGATPNQDLARRLEREQRGVLRRREEDLGDALAPFRVGSVPYLNEIGRASCRERVERLVVQEYVEKNREE